MNEPDSGTEPGGVPVPAVSSAACDAPPAVSRVLVVEDDETVADVVREILQDQPFELAFATSAEEAMRSVTESFPDLILTDISLPGKSGLDVMRFARAIDSEVAVILMTGYASVQTAIDALRQGADDYVTKPFEDIADLPAMVEKRLRGRRLRAENSSSNRWWNAFASASPVTPSRPGARRSRSSSSRAPSAAPSAPAAVRTSDCCSGRQRCLLRPRRSSAPTRSRPRNRGTPMHSRRSPGSDCHSPRAHHGSSWP